MPTLFVNDIVDVLDNFKYITIYIYIYSRNDEIIHEVVLAVIYVVLKSVLSELK